MPVGVSAGPVGGDELPAGLWVDGYEELWSALDTTRETERFWVGSRG